MFFWRELTKDKINIADALTELIVAGAEAKARKVFGAKMLDSRLEAVVAACAAPLTEADLAEWKIKVVANYQNILRGEFIEVAEAADAHALIIVESLRLYEEDVAVFGDFGFELWLWLESEIMDFGIKI